MREIQEGRALRAERDAVRAAIPEKPDGYELKLPESLKLPEGVEFTVDENDPALPMAREFAHKHGLSQDAFSELLGLKAHVDVAGDERMQSLMAKQIETLGANGANRLAAMTNWLTGRLPAEHAKALSDGVFSAKQVEAFEHLMRQFSGAGVPTLSRHGAEQQSAEISDEEWASMTPSQRLDAARKANAPTARR